MEVNYSRELTTKFLNKYKELERVMKDDYSRYIYFKQKYDSKFEMFRYIRNNLSHNESRADYPVIVAKSVYEDLAYILDLMKLKNSEKLTQISKLFVADLNAKVKDVIQKMVKQNYSFVPVLNDKKHVVGVISENTIVTYMNQTGEGLIYDDDTLITELGDLLELSRNPNERFLFVSNNGNFYESSKLFGNPGKDGKRVGALFVTNNGKQSQGLLGVITAWDVVE